MIYQSLEENELVGNNGYMDDEFKEKRKVYADKKRGLSLSIDENDADENDHEEDDDEDGETMESDEIKQVIVMGGAGVTRYANFRILYMNFMIHEF